MKHKRITVVSLLCMFLLAFSLTGFWAFSRVSDLAASAQQIAKIEESGTSLSLTVYGDPEGARQALEMFQYLEARDIEYGTSTTDPNGNPINAALEISEVEFSRTPDGDDDFYTAAGAGSVKGLDVHVDIGDMLNVDVEANEVAFGIEFWRLDNGLPAFNITAELTGNVYVSLSIAFLPLPGIQQALYEFSGDYYKINICIIKPLEITIINPPDGLRVHGGIEIQAEIKTAPGITLDEGSLHWWADGAEERNKGCHFEGKMNYDDGDGLWKSGWPTWHGGNGWYNLNVHAEGFQESVEGSKYRADSGIKVEVENPWVETYFIHPDGHWEEIHEIPIEIGGDTWKSWFSLPEWPDRSLTATGWLDGWWEGGIYFNNWIIQDESGTIIYDSDHNPTILIGDVYYMLFDGDMRARPLKCVYVVPE